MLPVIATDDEDLYITADTHFGHANIIKYCHRPFLALQDQAELLKAGGKWHNGSWKGPRENKYKISPQGVEIQDNTLIDLINATVPADAHLVHVGDFCLAPKDSSGWPAYAARVKAYRDRINCRKVSILWGNHDAPGPITDYFHWTGWKGQIELKKLDTVIVCDHTMNGVWDLSHRGSMHVYGHTHAEIEPFAELAMPGRRSMDVGVDNAAKLLGQYRPFRLKEVTDLLKDKPGFGFNPDTPTNYKGPTEAN